MHPHNASCGLLKRNGNYNGKKAAVLPKNSIVQNYIETPTNITAIYTTLCSWFLTIKMVKILLGS